MYKKIKINLDENLMNITNENSNLPLSLVIKHLLFEYNRNKNLRSKISKNINKNNNTY